VAAILSSTKLARKPNAPAAVAAVVAADTVVAAVVAVAEIAVAIVVVAAVVVAGVVIEVEIAVAAEIAATAGNVSRTKSQVIFFGRALCSPDFCFTSLLTIERLKISFSQLLFSFPPAQSSAQRSQCPPLRPQSRIIHSLNFFISNSPKFRVPSRSNQSAFFEALFSAHFVQIPLDSQYPCSKHSAG
jgi:hypothetical protein